MKIGRPPLLDDARHLATLLGLVDAYQARGLSERAAIRIIVSRGVEYQGLDGERRSWDSSETVRVHVKKARRLAKIDAAFRLSAERWAEDFLTQLSTS